MKNKVKSTLTERGMVKYGDRVVIGLSGGADSVCLTHLLCSLKDELGIEIMTAHLNHMIRGEAADRDAGFAAEFSASLGIRCEVKSVDVPKIAENGGISEETAGRNARYEFFSETLKKYGFNKIATAHNLNDSAETIAMNFMRGSAHLYGIPEKRADIIRPLLKISRAEIEAYCAKNGLKYVTDATNASDKYTRNRVRSTLIPLIERDFNPDFIHAVTRNSEIIRAEDEYLSRAAEDAYREIVHDGAADIGKLLDCHTAIARRVIRRMTGDIPSEFIFEILSLAKKNKSGSYINLPGGIDARIEYGRLIIGESDNVKPFEYALPIDRAVYVKEAGLTVLAERVSKRENDGAQYFSGADTDKLIVRSRRDGDFLFPAGMNGRKKLKDYFIDEKIPRSERGRTPVIVSGGDIMYVVGHRRDRRFAFGNEGIKIIITKDS